MTDRCGQPKSIQGDAAPHTASTDAKKSPAPAVAPVQPLNAPTPRDQELAKQMKTVAAELVSSKGFYERLADAVCTSERYSAPPNTPCWDGHRIVDT